MPSQAASHRARTVSRSRMILGSCAVVVMLLAALALAASHAARAAPIDPTAAARAAAGRPAPGDPPATSAPPDIAAGAPGPTFAPASHERIAVPPPPTRTFDQYVDALVAAGQQVLELQDAGDRDGAMRRDREAQLLFDEMLVQIDDADRQALAALSTTAPPAAAGRSDGDLRHRVLELALRVALQRRHARGDRDSRSAVDQLTAAILTLLPGSQRLAQDLGRGLLEGAPYLGATHEPQVLELLALSGEGRFDVDVARALLTTLWDNLRATGDRTSEQLTGLGLLLLDGGNTPERLAAGRLLLADDRYRLVVLEHLRRTRDERLARELAMAAAQQLPPTIALGVIAAAASVVDDQTAPLLTLGMRAPATLRQEYERRLGDDVQPRLRALLVSGAGFTGTEDGLEVARMALAQDPDPDVRMRALFALTGRAGATDGEAAIGRALDDPRIRDDPARLAGVVLALENLARDGLINAVDRLAPRLRTCAMLSPASRDHLERIVAQTLPGGAVGR
ncbi:MAG: hypothetical protein AB7O97_14130 [Planctomycetota bacterium]